jgi:hypothetical protein
MKKIFTYHSPAIVVLFAACQGGSELNRTEDKQRN